MEMQTFATIFVVFFVLLLSVFAPSSHSFEQRETLVVQILCVLFLCALTFMTLGIFALNVEHMHACIAHMLKF